MQAMLRVAAIAVSLALGQTQALANDKITFSLNWVPYGLHYGIFAAEAQGYYTKADLDVTIQRGYGSGDTVKRTAAGTADVGMADMASVIVGRSNGLKVKQVAVVLDRSADAIFYVKGLGINAPKDLPGHTLGATAGETTLNLMPAFAANAGFDNSKIEVVNLAPPAKFPALVSKKVESIVAFRTEEPAIMSAAQKAGVEVGRFLFSDFDVDYYSIGIIVSDEILAKRSEVIRRFVDATIRGYAFAIKNPEAAADAFAARFRESSRDLTLAQWKITMEHMVTDRSRAHGLGYIDRAKMQHTLELIRNYKDIKQDIKVDEIYSMSYFSKVDVPK